MAHEFVNNGVRVVIQAQAPSGQELLHVFHMRAPSADPDYAEVLACAQVVGSWWGSDYRNMVPTATIGRQVVATGMSSVPAAQATAVLSLVGTRGANAAPGEISCALKFFTHLSGRRNHGGVRAWGPVPTDYVGDHFTASYMAAITGVFQNLLNQANAAGFPIVIFSTADVTLKTVAGVLAIDDIVDSQRRRMLGRGR